MSVRIFTAGFHWKMLTLIEYCTNLNENKYLGYGESTIFMLYGSLGSQINNDIPGMSMSIFLDDCFLY